MLQIRLKDPLTNPCSGLIPPSVHSQPSTELATITILFYGFPELFPMYFEILSSHFGFIYLNVLLTWFQNQFLKSLNVENKQNPECVPQREREVSPSRK